MSYGQMPFGIRQIALYDTAGANKVLLPAALMLHVTPLLQSARFEADGRLVGAASFVAGADWELETGGISLEALARLTGDRWPPVSISAPFRGARRRIRKSSPGTPSS